MNSAVRGLLFNVKLAFHEVLHLLSESGTQSGWHSIATSLDDSPFGPFLTVKMIDGGGPEIGQPFIDQFFAILLEKSVACVGGYR